MSKVWVDRELLELIERTWRAKLDPDPGAGNVVHGLLRLRNILAQPAEADGVEAFDLGDGSGARVVYADDHLAALSAVTAERDRLQRNLKFTEQWYAVRFERLADLGKSAGCWDAMAAIIANGTADPYESPTYAQQLVRANHRADVAERESDQLRAEVEALRNEHTARESMARRLLWLAFVWNDHNFEKAHIEARREAEAHGITTLEQANEWLSRIDAAMAAKEGKS